MEKILLVTGGAGFIGSAFIRYYLNTYTDHKIVNLDSLTYAGNLSNLDGLNLNPGYFFVKGDINSEKDVKDVFEQFSPHIVVHFAAESHVDKSILNANEFVRTNVMGTQNLLRAARDNNIERFIHVSSDEVYGSCAPGEFFREDSPLRPTSPYAASKAASDLLALAMWKTHRFPVIITRCTNNYGPFQFPEKLIPMTIVNTLMKKDIPIYGDGTNVRDWIHVDDHCRALGSVIENGEPGRTYNIAAGNSHKNIDVVERICEIQGYDRRYITYVDDRPGHDLRYAVDSGRIRNELGWQPQIDFETGLERTVQWFTEHMEWVDDIISGEYRNYYQQMYEEI